jgi:hypothetical protein
MPAGHVNFKHQPPLLVLGRFEPGPQADLGNAYPVAVNKVAYINNTHCMYMKTQALKGKIA